jgi:hypothetical protein
MGSECKMEKVCLCVKCSVPAGQARLEADGGVSQLARAFAFLINCSERSQRIFRVACGPAIGNQRISRKG